jgi:predicted nucleic acid-binding Zn ribbon protein
MSSSESAPVASPDCVRTPVLASLCPVCGAVELQGRQQVCSAACRRERGRQRQLAGLRASVLALRSALDDLLVKVEALRGPRRAKSRRP